MLSLHDALPISILANEKGGTGKSTCAVQFAVALASQGWRVAGIDLDPRQRTFHRYLENRRNTEKRRDITLPTPHFEVFEGTTVEELDEQVARLSVDADYLKIGRAACRERVCKYV